LRFTDRETRKEYIKETQEKYIPLFEVEHKGIAKKIKEIIELYKNNELELEVEEWEVKILEKYTK